MRSVRQWGRNRAGTAAVEFALIVPVLLLLLAGIVEFGRAFVVYTVVNRLSSQYAIAWADCSDTPTGTCSTELSNYTASYSITNIAPQLTAANLSLRMFQVQMPTSGNTPAVVYAYPSSATLSAAETTLAQSTFTSGQSGVIVTASYTHSLVYFQAMMTPFLGSFLTPSYTVAQLKS